ncbi:MAG: lysozyme [Symploca sp. SIO1B1]|nr:lysozyme [Symploca sp. SIO1B1]
MNGNPGDGEQKPSDPGTNPTPNPTRNNVSDQGLEFIAGHEGIRLNLYNDPAGHCTIGVGHLVHFGNCNQTESSELEFLNGISEEQAYEILREDAQEAVNAVIQYISVPLNQAQFDALVSFTFNLGSGSLQSSDLRQRLNNGEYDAVPEELNRWIYSNGTIYPGLVRRRKEEGILFRDGIYT